MRTTRSTTGQLSSSFLLVLHVPVGDVLGPDGGATRNAVIFRGGEGGIRLRRPPSLTLVLPARSVTDRPPDLQPRAAGRESQGASSLREWDARLRFESIDSNRGKSWRRGRDSPDEARRSRH